MIVDDDKMGVAVEFMADDATAARIRYQATKAENKSKLIYHRLFLSFNSGTVAEREARAICSPEYQEAKEEEALALAELEALRQRRDWAETIREIWRTENANARAAERIR